MKGYRTLLWNGGTAVVLALLTWAAGVNWAEYVSPTVAMIIVTGVNAILRMFTNTQVGNSR